MIEKKMICDWNNLKDWIRNAPNYAEEFVRNHKKPVYLYGGGWACYWYLKYFKSREIEISGIIESNPEKLSGGVYGYPIVSLDEMLKNNKEYSIVITAPKYLDEIKEILEERCEPDSIYSFEGELYYNFIRDVELYRNYIISNWERIIELRDALEDDLSKETLKSFLQGRISGDQRFFIDCMKPDQYYPKDILLFTETENMVECGSNNGDTLNEFLTVVDNHYDRCYLFEPDEECIRVLKKRIHEEWKSDKINLVERGAWDSETELFFDADPEYGASHIVHKSETKILTGTIDELVDAPVSFIKMDIEGAELKALKGAIETIKKYRPKLAICIYHEKGDFLDIPEWLHSIVPEYKLYIRHHNWGATETVLYAKI